MNNPNYYAILTADVRYCPNLSPQEKLLFAEITALSQKDGVCFAGNNYFAELYGLTDTTISHQISDLEKLGFIKIEFEKEGARVKKRMITVAKNRNGDAVFLAKKSNGTVAKNRKDNNTSILTLQVYTTQQRLLIYLSKVFREPTRKSTVLTNRKKTMQKTSFLFLKNMNGQKLTG